jgi:PAS domain-containing protein
MTAAPALNLYQQILNAIPTPVFLVDKDMFVLEYNQAAHHLLIAPARSQPGQRGGHVLSCLNATKRTEGCGRTPHCAKCGLRNALNKAREGERQIQTWATLRLVRDNESQDRVFRITISPFNLSGEPAWLLVMDDRTEQAALENVFPLCASCREFRQDDALRREAEAYLTRHWEKDPAACLCAECRQRVLGAQD